MDALHSAARIDSEENSLALMNLYLECGANINEREIEGRGIVPGRAQVYNRGTTLHIPARHGSVPRAFLLVERGADLTIKSTYDETPLHWAQIWGKSATANYLQEVVDARGIPIEELQIDDDDDDDDADDLQEEELVQEE